MRTTISCRFFAQLLGLLLATAGVPLHAEKERFVLPILPGTARWSVAVSAATTSPPVMTEHQVFAVLPAGVIAAFRIDEGTELWRVELDAAFPLVVAGDHLFVAAGEAIHALRVKDGSVAWRQPAGTLSAPMLVQDGWVITVAGDQATARRATDGTVVWTHATGPVNHRPAIEGSTVFFGVTDGGILALDVATGKKRWHRKLPGAPSEMLALPGRLYLGSENKYFYCLDSADGNMEWKLRVGSSVIGRPAVDIDRVYFAAMDNMLRAVDRYSGSTRWNVGVNFRPTGGPLLVGPTVLVPGASAELRTFDPVTGRTVAPIPFGERLASPPSFRETEKGPIAVAVTGGLTAEWKLSVLEPSMAIPVGPLSVLPGQPVKFVPGVVASAAQPVPLAPPPPAAAHLP